MQTNMEMDDAKVSVIIPVYNTGKYVREAVESIMKQTLKELEIIIINDGSTDNSLEIVEELSKSDDRIQVFSQANQGPSIARNTGIAHAHGKYLYFMDSDDILEEDAMEVCFKKCEEEQLDFVFFDAVSFRDGDYTNILPQLSYQRTDKFENKIYTGQEAFKKQLENRTFTPSSCLNLISKRILIEKRLQYYPGIVHEDQLFLVELYINAQRTACIQRSFFHRRIRKDSIMTSKFSTKNLIGYLTVTQKIIDLKTQMLTPEAKAIINLYLSQMLNAVVWQAHTLDLPARLKLAALCLSKYKKYVSTRSIAVLLLKSSSAK